jgi:hypothetical protein
VLSLLAAHSSSLAKTSVGIRAEIMGSRPVAGRPRPLFWSTNIDFRIIMVYLKCCPMARREESRMVDTRKIREDPTAEETERLRKYGSLTFKSIRRPDMRVEKFIPSREQH